MIKDWGFDLEKKKARKIFVSHIVVSANRIRVDKLNFLVILQGVHLIDQL